MQVWLGGMYNFPTWKNCLWNICEFYY